MKKLCRTGVFAALLFCLQPTSAQIPVAYYPFSGNANDAIGNLNGTVQGGASLTTDRFGNAGSAYSFDGIDDAISFAAVPMNNTDNFSLLAWVNPSIFDPGNQFNKMIISLGPGTNGYNMGMGNNNGSGSGNQLGGLYNLVSWLPSGAFLNTINTWYHIAMVRENGITKFYLNGVLAPNTFNPSPNAFTTAFQIGGQDFDPTHYWNGKIDEVKIYNVGLTASQVQQEYASGSQLQKPGSGNAISFDGIDQSISIPNSAATNFGINDFSVAFWYNSSDNGRGEIIFEKRDDNCGDGQNWAVRKSASEVYFEINVPGPTSDLVIIPNAADSQWHHIVFTRNTTQLSGFKDGMLIATTPATAQNVSNGAPLQIGTGPCSPFFPGGNGFFNGSLDEVQLWNMALTQSQIRDRMCHKIISSDPLYSNLAAYYNFDESTGSIVFDGTVNANNGTLANNPTRVTSGAAIGNASNHDYINVTRSASINHPTGESFTVTSTSGSPDGIHVYRVDEQPNTINGTVGVGSNDKYFGVFQVNGTSSQCTAVYNYSGNPFVTAVIQPQLRLHQRADNAADSWNIMATAANETNKTITVTGENMEYILGSLGNALPVRILSFFGIIKDKVVSLQWKVTAEINTAFYEVEHSSNGIVFEKTGNVIAKNNAGINDYFLDDKSPAKGMNFYRLKQVDRDGHFNYSDIIRVFMAAKALNIYPNPASQFLQFDFNGKQRTVTVHVSDAQGSQVMMTQMSNELPLKINIEKLAKGKYFVQISDGATTETGSFIKQ